MIYKKKKKSAPKKLKSMQGQKAKGSIIQFSKECYISQRTDHLHKHHIFEGNPLRQLSDWYGLWVWLNEKYHNTSNEGVHCGDHELDIQLKQDAQRAFERTHSRTEFMKIFGRNYLE